MGRSSRAVFATTCARRRLPTIGLNSCISDTERYVSSTFINSFFPAPVLVLCIQRTSQLQHPFLRCMLFTAGVLITILLAYTITSPKLIHTLTHYTHTQTIAAYLNNSVVSSLRELQGQGGEAMLREFVRRGANHNIMNEWYRKFFMYLVRINHIYTNVFCCLCVQVWCMML
jgi:hypothetical protein